MNSLYKESLKAGYISWMASPNNRYHLTISFPRDTFHNETRRLLNKLITHLNRRIFKGRYKNGLSYLQGFAVREITYSLYTDHYHIILVDEEMNLPNYARFKELIEKEINRFRSSGERNFIKSFKLQDYYNSEGDDFLETYLTKQFRYSSISIEQASDSIGVLSVDRVEFGRGTFIH